MDCWSATPTVLLPSTSCFSRPTNDAVPSSAVLSRLAQLRLEPDSSEGSSPDEGAQKKGSGWTGRGRPLLVGSSFSVREICDGQPLASPGRWAVDDRRYPEDSVWSEVAKRYMTCPEKVGTPELLTSLALGKISSCPFPPEEIDALKQGVIGFLRTKGLLLGRHHEDRSDVPIDFLYLPLLLQAAQDPESSLGEFSRVVRVGPGSRLPRLPALALSEKEEVEIAGSMRPLRGYLEDEIVGDPMWRQNYSSISEHASRIIDVLNDQSSSQILKLPEAEARLQFPHLVVAYRSNGIPVTRDQERAPLAFDLERFMREKARRGEQTLPKRTGRCRTGESDIYLGASSRREAMYLLVPLGRLVSPPPRATGHTLPHRLDGLLNVFQDDQTLRGVNWWLMISTLKLGEVIIEPH